MIKTFVDPGVVPGDEVRFGNLNCVVLEHFGDSILAISKKIIKNMAFNERGHNSFNGSTLRSYLNNHLINGLENYGVDINVLCEFAIDLTCDDGDRGAGDSFNKVNLLTCDMYRKYRRFIPMLDHWWWLATPYSRKSTRYSSHVCFVDVDGTLNIADMRNGCGGVRPIFLFKARNQDLSSFTNEDLLREVAARNIKNITNY